MLFDSAKNGPSTAIWVACARIAARFCSANAVPSTALVTTSSGLPSGSSSADSTPSKNVWSPAARSASIPRCSTDFGTTAQYTFATVHGSPPSPGSAARSTAAMATRWAMMWSGWP